MGYKTIGLEIEGPLANSSGMEIKGTKWMADKFNAADEMRSDFPLEL